MTSYEARTHWPVTKAVAEDLPTVLSLIHRLLDGTDMLLLCRLAFAAESRPSSVLTSTGTEAAAFPVAPFVGSALNPYASNARCAATALPP